MGFSKSVFILAFITPLVFTASLVGAPTEELSAESQQ